jgi:hypothetical protein
MHALSAERRHIVYSDSGAGVLKYAASRLRMEPLRDLQCYGPALQAFLGPINLLARPAERRVWLDAHARDADVWWGLDAEKRSAYDAKLTTWWDELRTSARPTTIWHCSRDVADVSFLLALSSEGMLGEDIVLVDVALSDLDPSEIISTGECRPEEILASADHAVSLTSRHIDLLKSRYEQLQKSTKSLRRFDPNGDVEEAAINSHDAVIRQFISTEWRPYRNIMSDILDSQKTRAVRDMEYAFVLWRVALMAAEGEIERRGASDRPLFKDDPLLGDLRLAN